MSDAPNGEKSVGINYASNSNKAQPSEPTEESRDIKPIIVGQATERKEPIRRKFFAAYAGDNAQTVGQYLLMDVVVPTTKNLISDLVTQGINRLLFGTSRPANGGVSGIAGRVNYSNMFNGGANRQQQTPSGPQMSQQARANHQFGEIILTSRSDGEMVIDELRNLIEAYGSAKVVDLYSLVGITGQWTDQKYGWKNLQRASVQQIREGFLLDLPRPEVL